MTANFVTRRLRAGRAAFHDQHFLVSAARAAREAVTTGD